MGQEEFLAFKPYVDWLFFSALILMGILFLVRVIQYIIYVRDCRRRVDYWNNRPLGVKWWHHGLSSIFGFIWFVVTKNLEKDNKSCK